MARPDRTHWAKDTTPMLIAALVDDDGNLVKFVRAHDQYFPNKSPDTRISNMFALCGLPEVYAPTQNNLRLHLKCANSQCRAKLNYVARHAYEDDLEQNRAHFRSRKISDHVSNCAFKNPARAHNKKLTLNQAIADDDAPIFVNIHLKTGFQGKARIGSDYLNDHARWQMAHKGIPHAVVPVDSLEGLIKLRERVASGGEDKLAKLYYGKNTMVLTHEHFWLAPQTEHDLVRARDNTGRPDIAPYIKVFKELLQEAEKPENRHLRDSTREARLYGMTRVIAFHVAGAPHDFNASSRTVHGRPIDLRGTCRLQQDMRLEYMTGQVWSTADAEKKITEKLQTGRRFLVAASPSMEFSNNPMERARQMRTLRAIIDGGTISIEDARNLKITWHVVDEKQIVHQAYPQRAMSKEFKSAIIRYGDLPYDQVAGPRASLVPEKITGKRKDPASEPIANSGKGYQLKLL